MRLTKLEISKNDTKAKKELIKSPCWHYESNSTASEVDKYQAQCSTRLFCDMALPGLPAT